MDGQGKLNIQKIGHLIDKGKEKGFLTYDQINTHLEEGLVNVQQVDGVIKIFLEMGINVMAEEDVAEKNIAFNKGLLRKEDSSLKSEKNQQSGGSSTNPIQRYLRDIGSLELMTREGEIEACKRIEKSQRDIRNVIISIPFFEKVIVSKLREALDIYDESLVTGELPVFKGLLTIEDKVINAGAIVNHDQEEDIDYDCEDEHMDIPRTSDGLPIISRVVSASSQASDANKAMRGFMDALNTPEGQVHKEDFLSNIPFDPSVFKGLEERLQALQKEVMDHEKEIRDTFTKASVPLNIFRDAYLKKNKGVNWVRTLIKRNQNQAWSKNLFPYLRKISMYEQRILGIMESLSININDFRKLARQFSLAKARRNQAKTDMSHANLRLVISVAKKHVRANLEFTDLVQEGNIGMLKAIDKFDWRRGYKFSTYATWWIRQAITRFITDSSRMVRVPNNMVYQISSMQKARGRFLAEHGVPPSLEQIAEKMGTDKQRVEFLISIEGKTSSLNAPSHADGEQEEIESVESVGTDMDEPLFKSALENQVEYAMGALTKREKMVLDMRFGRGMNADYTLEQIGQQLGVSRERIRQIEAKALRKLSHPSWSLDLKVFHDG